MRAVCKRNQSWTAWFQSGKDDGENGSTVPSEYFPIGAFYFPFTLVALEVVGRMKPPVRRAAATAAAADDAADDCCPTADERPETGVGLTPPPVPDPARLPLLVDLLPEGILPLDGAGE